MKPRLYPTTVVLMLLATAQAQLRPEKLKRLEEADPASAAVDAWQAGVEKSYSKDGLISPSFAGRWIIESEALKALFPNYRFLAIEWSERPAPGKEGQALGLAFGLGITLVCDSKGKLVKEVFHSGNYESFGEMLQDAKASLRNPEDAKRIWSAFCDLHQMHWEKQPALKIDETTWHLGDVTIERYHYFYEVKLDQQGLVISAKLESEEVPEKK